MKNAMRIQPTISVANNGITPVFNTTLGLDEAQSSTAIGTKRGMFAGKWLYIPRYLVTAQNVTLTFQSLVNGAWASTPSDDVPTGFIGGGNVITANASAQTGFVHFLAGDENVFFTNGGTGPTVFTFDAYITDQFPGNWS